MNRSLLRAGALGALSFAFAGPAFAACPTLAGPATLAAGAEFLEVEGPVSAIDTVDRTVTVIGTCVNIPAGLLIDTDADAVGDITLDELMDPSLYSPLGGTIILTGVAAIDGLGNIGYTADSVFFEFGEHVLAGPLVSVDSVAGTFVVGTSTVTINTDPRMPGDILDLGGNLISINDMLGYEGTLVAAEGYFRGGIHYARLVETEVVVPGVGTDTVVIERAQYRSSKRSVQVRGQVTASPVDGSFASTVSIDVGCNGTVDNVASTIVDPVLGLAEFRYQSGNNAFATAPANVCVTSPNGGTATRVMDVI